MAADIIERRIAKRERNGNERGAVLVEYLIKVSAIAVVCLNVIGLLGARIQDVACDTYDGLQGNSNRYYVWHGNQNNYNTWYCFDQMGGDNQILF